uniref:Capsid protein n=1 Tax=Eptesicus serotinus feces associated circovirus TaxID=3139973 RepID=A0AAU6S521_9CIRC
MAPRRYRRRPLRRRRYRPRIYPRRRYMRRRRMYIHRPRAGRYFLQKFSWCQYNTISVGTNHTKAGAVSWKLSEFFQGSPTFDYYKIIMASWSLVPSTDPSTWSAYGRATLIVDYDDDTITQQPTTLSFMANASRQIWNPQKGVYRRIRPKPTLGAVGGQSNYVIRGSGPFLNSLDNGHKYLGLKYCMYSPNTNQTFPFFETKQIWVLWKNQL